MQRFPADGGRGMVPSDLGTIPAGNLPVRVGIGGSAVEAHLVGPAAAELCNSECSAEPTR